MKFKVNSKIFGITVGSVSVISFGYFCQKFVSKNFNIFGKTPIQTIGSDDNEDYIVLNNDLTIDSLAEYTESDLTLDHRSESSRSHYHLLRLAQTQRDSMVRQFAIDVISRTQFNDYQFREFAQTCDFKTAIRLARIPGVSSKLFMPPMSTKFIKLDNISVREFDLEMVLQNMFRKALNSGYECSECTKFFTQLSIEKLETGRHSQQLHESIDFSDIHDITRHSRRVSEVDWLYLQTISQNILCGERQCRTLIENGLFLVLHHLRDNFSEPKIQYWIGQTLANLSAHKESHSHFWSNRWLSVLVEWLQSNRLESSLFAAKILYNLNEDSNQSLLSESMYLLHPIFEEHSDKQMDIVLIHGLLGGAVKTWRQNDSQKDIECYTQCWPKDWLARDVSDIRVLAVNYQTFLSNWNIECHDNNSAFDLKQRSNQLLNDLIKAKVGQKPIVWITHSMGGLLVKQMLVEIIDTKDHKFKPILDQTKGIVFYSVPHKGSDMAVFSPYLQRILSPSSETLELRKDSKLLLSLHNRFLKLSEDKSIECLSFGETLKSVVIKRPFKWTYLLVPEDSSNPGVGEFHLLDVDHFNTCKPKDKFSEVYERTVGFINALFESNITSDNKKSDKIYAFMKSIFI